MGSDSDRLGNSDTPAGFPLAGDGAPGGQGAASDSTTGCRYAIRVDGLMDAHWSQWLDGMTIMHEEGGITRLEGIVIDQAALYGLLNKMRDLRLTLLTVERLGREAERHLESDGAPFSEEPPESPA